MGEDDNEVVYIGERACLHRFLEVPVVGAACLCLLCTISEVSSIKRAGEYEKSVLALLKMSPAGARPKGSQYLCGLNNPDIWVCHIAKYTQNNTETKTCRYPENVSGVARALRPS